MMMMEWRQWVRERAVERNDDDDDGVEAGGEREGGGERGMMLEWRQ